MHLKLEKRISQPACCKKHEFVSNLYHFYCNCNHNMDFKTIRIILFLKIQHELNGGLGERCKLSQRGLGRSPSRKRNFMNLGHILELRHAFKTGKKEQSACSKNHEFVSNLYHFHCNCNRNMDFKISSFGNVGKIKINIVHRMGATSLAARIHLNCSCGAFLKVKAKDVVHFLRFCVNPKQGCC